MKKVAALSLMIVFGLASCDPVVGESSSFSTSSSLAESSFSSSTASEGTSISDSLPSLESSATSSQSSSNWTSLPSSQSEKESQASSQTMSSSVPSSTDSSLDSSEEGDYCTVSLYQSNFSRTHTHVQGDVRFDKTIRVKTGDPIYNNLEELQDFYFVLSPRIVVYGDGAYSILYLYYDEDCTVLYRSGTPILTDSSFYYYCQG